MRNEILSAQASGAPFLTEYLTDGSRTVKLPKCSKCRNYFTFQALIDIFPEKEACIKDLKELYEEKAMRDKAKKL